MIWIISFTLAYVSVCVGIYVGTYKTREKTRKINDAIIEQGEKAEREYMAITFIEAHAGNDVLIPELDKRVQELYSTKCAKDSVIERRNKRTH